MNRTRNTNLGQSVVQGSNLMMDSIMPFVHIEYHNKSRILESSFATKLEKNQTLKCDPRFVFKSSNLEFSVFYNDASKNHGFSFIINRFDIIFMINNI